MSIPKTSLRPLILIQFGLSIVSFLATLLLVGVQLAASTAVGGLLILASLILHAVIWQRLMAKKSIACTLLIIVIKYAVLLGSVWYLVQTDWFKPLGLVLGISTFVIAALFFALMERKKETDNFDSGTF